jgi:endonuclease YncB( thermonuclease family)
VRWQKVAIVVLAITFSLGNLGDGGAPEQTVASVQSGGAEGPTEGRARRQAVVHAALESSERRRLAAAEAEPTEEPTAEAKGEVAITRTQPRPPPPVRSSSTAWEVINIVDGDTIDVRSSAGVTERVRIIGIDTPERGECGFSEAASALASMVSGKSVRLPSGARDDRDRYERILRYVDADGRDAGRELIIKGFAIARYDSRDGYGRHPREAAYVAVDRASPAYTCPAPASKPAPPPAPKPVPAPVPAPAPATAGGPGSGPGGAWANCSEARNAGAAPVMRGTPGYGAHLDRDNDGTGCE